MQCCYSLFSILAPSGYKKNSTLYKVNSKHQVYSFPHPCNVWASYLSFLCQILAWIWIKISTQKSEQIRSLASNAWEKLMLHLELNPANTARNPLGEILQTKVQIEDFSPSWICLGLDLPQICSEETSDVSFPMAIKGAVCHFHHFCSPVAICLNCPEQKWMICDHQDKQLTEQ